MDMHSRNEYLKALISERGYHRKTKKEKTKLLDEYCRTTGQNRNYVIRKIRAGRFQSPRFGKRQRRASYDGEVVAALAQLWRIFDYPCGQRLEPLLKAEVDRLRALKELSCSDAVAAKLKVIDASTIDAKLAHEKEVERARRKVRPKVHPLLYQRIPVKVFAEQDRTNEGNVQVDLVEHCGASARGEYLHTLATTDLASGWWEGEVVMGRGQEGVVRALSRGAGRYPFPWRELHTDNDAAFINHHLYRYCEGNGLDFSRSRPYKKNDNCLVEQKNWTHVKRLVGYLRYDTEEERAILADLYRGNLRLYKNFFQPVMKLASKERVGGRVHRRYDTPQTPYQRVMESREIPPATKQLLQATYKVLNPAQLKRAIEAKLDELWRAYQRKQRQPKVASPAKRRSASLTSYIRQPKAFHLPG